MDTPKYLHFTTISKKLDNKKLFPIISKIRESYWNHFNTALTIKENFLVWGHETQNMPYWQLGEVFGVKKSQAHLDYRKAKKKLRGGGK